LKNRPWALGVKLGGGGGIGMNQSLRYTRPFPPTLTPNFYLPLSNLVVKKYS
jgi:hypothetical protein